MKAIIFSDSHKSFAPMITAIENEGTVQQIIHAGDVHSDIEDLGIMYPKIPLAFVKGNNDVFLRDVPEDRIFDFYGIRIFLTHGHNYGVKYSLAALLKKGQDVGANLIIFGHTHQPYKEKIQGITLFNPGATTRSYGVLEVLDGDFRLEIKKIP